MIDVVLWLSLVAACVVVGMTYSRFTPGDCCGCGIAVCECDKCENDEAACDYTVEVSGSTGVDGTYILEQGTSPVPGTYCLWTLSISGGACGFSRLDFRIYTSSFGATQKTIDVLFWFVGPGCVVSTSIPTTGDGTEADCLAISGETLNNRVGCGNIIGQPCDLTSAVATVTAGG